MKRRTFLKFGTGAALGGPLAACGGGNGTFDPLPGAAPQVTAVAGWTQAALQAVRTARPEPPMAARALAILHTCMYNAWTAFDDRARPSHGQAIRLPAGERTAANKTAALCVAAHAALVDQFPAQQAAFDACLASFGPRAPAGNPAAAAAIALATAELLFRRGDGAGQPGEVAWDKVTPFALQPAGQFRPAPPAVFGSAAYETQARRLLEVLAGLTERQKVIAGYWDDGPGTELPPGHWNLFALFVSGRDRHTDDDDVKLFFALSNALADAAIACWDAGRAHDPAPPIVTALRILFHGQTIPGFGPLGPAGGLVLVAGEAWAPFLQLASPAPPFAGCVSGHSACGMAAAEVLRSCTGSDLFGASFTTAAHSLAAAPGLPSHDLTLGWDTFSAAAEQAGLSRVYGGLQFDSAHAAGMELGRKVGAAAFAKARGCWEGTV